MATFNNVTIENTWVDVSTSSGAVITAAYAIQNIGVDAVYLKESANAPTTDDGAVLFGAQFGELSKAEIQANSNKM
jgi:hypothetical protein